VLFCVFVAPYLMTKISPVLLVIAVVMIVYTFAVLLITSFMDPGFLPKQSPDPKMEELMAQFSEYPAYTKREGPIPKKEILLPQDYLIKVSYCTTCHFYRPPRCSHCSDCDRCVERFDHHCPWVGNCVGKRNYRFFVQFVFSAALLCFYVCGCCILEIVMIFQETTSFLEAALRSPFTPLIALFTFFMFFSVAGLAGYHQYLICNGTTTNEELKGTFRKKPNPWDKGWWRNCLVLACCPPLFPSLDNESRFFRPGFCSSSSSSPEEKRKEKSKGRITDYLENDPEEKKPLRVVEDV